MRIWVTSAMRFRLTASPSVDQHQRMCWPTESMRENEVLRYDTPTRATLLERGVYGDPTARTPDAASENTCIWRQRRIVQRVYQRSSERNAGNEPPAERSLHHSSRPRCTRH